MIILLEAVGVFWYERYVFHPLYSIDLCTIP